MIDPRDASVCFTPLDLRHRLHPTVGHLMILPTAEVQNVLDPAPVPGDHTVWARPPQRNTFAEAVPVVPDSEADPLRGALLTAVRLITMDGLDPAKVLGVFAAQVAGWADALPDGRLRGRQRMVNR